MMTKIRFAATLLLLTPMLAAQNRDDDELKSVRAELDRLRDRAVAVPELDIATRRALGQRLPDPDLRLVDIANRLEQIAKLHDDTALAPRAWRLLGRTLARLEDPTRALAALKKAESIANDYDKYDLAFAQAEVLAGHGALAPAIAAADKILASEALARLKTKVTDAVAKWRKTQTYVERQRIDLDAIVASRRARDRSHAAAAMRRFVNRYPLDRQTLELIGKLLADDPSSDSPLRRLLGERLLLFYPDRDGVATQGPALVQYLFHEGDYEKVLFHGQRLLAKSERLRPNDVAALRTSMKSARAALGRVQARKLDVTPATRWNRERRLRRDMTREEELTLADAVRDYATDYPRSSATADLLFTVANRLRSREPAEASELYLRAARDNRFPNAGAALVAAADLAATSDGPDAGLEALDKVKLSEDSPPEGRVRVGLARARYLDELDRWEEARDALDPLITLTRDPQVKREIAARLVDLKKKIGD